jgi:hypothetical protein
MTSRWLSFAVWALIALTLIGAQVVAMTTHRIPSVTDVVRRAVRHPAVRVICLVGWLWLGWHFFVRSSR